MFLGIFLLETPLFSADSSPKTIRLYNSTGEMVENYDELIAQIEVGDTLDFADGNLFKVEKFFVRSSGTDLTSMDNSLTVVIRTEDGKVLKFAKSKFFAFQNDIMHHAYIEDLRDSGIPHARLLNAENPNPRYALVEEIEYQFSFQDLIYSKNQKHSAPMKGLQQATRKISRTERDQAYRGLVEFAKAHANVAEIGDFKFEQLVWNGKTWILMDWPPDAIPEGGVHILRYAKSVDDTNFLHRLGDLESHVPRSVRRKISATVKQERRRLIQSGKGLTPEHPFHPYRGKFRVGIEFEVPIKNLTIIVDYFDFEELLERIEKPEIKNRLDTTSKKILEHRNFTKKNKARLIIAAAREREVVKLKAGPTPGFLENMVWEFDDGTLEFKSKQPLLAIDTFVDQTEEFAKQVGLEHLLEGKGEKFPKTNPKIDSTFSKRPSFHFHISTVDERDLTSTAKRVNRLALLRFLKKGETGALTTSIPDIRFQMTDPKHQKVLGRGIIRHAPSPDPDLVVGDLNRMEVRRTVENFREDLLFHLETLSLPEDQVDAYLDHQIKRDLTSKAKRQILEHYPKAISEFKEYLSEEEFSHLLQQMTPAQRRSTFYYLDEVDPRYERELLFSLKQADNPEYAARALTKVKSISPKTSQELWKIAAKPVRSVKDLQASYNSIFVLENQLGLEGFLQKLKKKGKKTEHSVFQNIEKTFRELPSAVDHPGLTRRKLLEIAYEIAPTSQDFLRVAENAIHSFDFNAEEILDFIAKHKVNSPEIQVKIVDLLNGSTTKIRASAYQALVDLGVSDPRAIQSIKAIQKSNPNPDVKKNASKLLRQVQQNLKSILTPCVVQNLQTSGAPI